MKKLPKSCTDALYQAESELSRAIEAAREYYDERTEKWHDSHAGGNYSAWLDELDAALDILQNLETAPGGES